MKPIIEIKNLSKLYRLGVVGTGTLSHDLKRWYYQVRGRDDPFIKIGEENERGTKGTSDYVWALKDINIEVMPGEVLGIIGKNGAGKSTLLKILSKVTGPTTGQIRFRGRIGALLEVGTGFHPELTGRENIFLNGAILGMARVEIKSKLDEIIEFSGVEKYIDTPVKRYSSGMIVRLGFAVAAHLDPEILIIDEVLAVGDAEFQKKAIGKVHEVSHNHGRTVLFVSHNMAAIKSLCNSAIVLNNGELVFKGNQIEAVGNYLKSTRTNIDYISNGDMSNWEGNEHIRIEHFNVIPLAGNVLSISSGINFEVVFFNYKENINLDVTFELSTFEEIVVLHHGALISTENDSKQGFYKVSGRIPGYLLNAGLYKFKILFGENQRYLLFSRNEIVSFEILNESFGSNSSIFPGVIRPNINYQISFEIEHNHSE